MAEDHPKTAVGETPTAAAGSPSHTPPAADLVPGTHIGRFTVTGPLGKGGMGVVYAAHDPELNRSVAVKLLRVGRGGDDARARLLREAQAMARLSHPNVVAVHEVGTDGDTVFVAMERVDGQTLKTWLHEKPRSTSEILAVFLQAARGLAAAHAAGLIHRDFKPDNVLLSTDGRARVSDFGVARAVDATVPDDPGVPTGSDAFHSPLTLAGAVVGTLAYMSPEQLRGQPVDARTDEFCFCIALYEALYGRRPYAREETNLIRRPPPAGHNVPRWLAAVLERGLSLPPDDRYPDMKSLIAALEADPAPRRRRVLTALGALALGVAAIAVTLRLTHRASACDDPSHALDSVWNAQVSQALEAAFLATGVPDAAVRWSYTKKAIDRQANLWLQTEANVCVGGNSRGQGDAATVVRLECLERQRDALGLLLQLFQQPTPAMVAAAVVTVHGLDLPMECDDASTVPILDHLPPEKEAKAKAIRADVVRELVKRESGEAKEAIEMQLKSLADAQALGDAPLEVAIDRGLASKYARIGDHRTAVKYSRNAMRLAETERMDLDAAAAAAELAIDLQLGGFPSAEVDTVLDDLQRAVARAHDAPRARRDAEFAVGSILNSRSKPTEALPHLKESIRLSRETEGPDTLNVTMQLNNLGFSLDNLGRYDEAVAIYREALALIERVKGPSSSGSKLLWVNLGWDLRDMGRLAEAHQALAHCLEPPETLYTAEARALLAETDEENGRHAEAKDHALKAMAYLTGAKLDRGPEFVDISCRTSLVHAEQGDRARALEIADRGMKAADVFYRPDSTDLVPLLTRFGGAYVLSGKSERGAAILERALKLGTHPFYPGLIASARYYLARALVGSHGDRKRAEALAREAERELSTIDFRKPLYDQVASWRRATFPGR